MRLSYVVPAVFLAAQVSASPKVLRGLLVGRQISSDVLASIPEPCQPACAPAVTTINGCSAGPPDAMEGCICTSDVRSELTPCLECVVTWVRDNAGEAAADDIQSQVDAALTNFDNVCAGGGSDPEPSSSVEPESSSTVPPSSSSSVPPSSTRPSSSTSSTPRSSSTRSSVAPSGSDIPDEDDGSDDDAGVVSTLSVGAMVMSALVALHFF